jgi:hypothetical protein
VLQQLHQFIDDNFFVCWCVGFTFCLLGFAAMAWWQIATGPRFPPLSSVKVLHRERFASGCSHLSLITRLGGAENMLTVVLTENELWITTFALFRGLCGFYDLDHRIPIDTITDVVDARKSLMIHFTRPNGTPAAIQLRLRDKDGFQTALSTIRDVAAPRVMNDNNNGT